MTATEEQKCDSHAAEGGTRQAQEARIRKTISVNRGVERSGEEDKRVPTGEGQGDGEALDLSLVSGISTELIRSPFIGVRLVTSCCPDDDAGGGTRRQSGMGTRGGRR